MAAKSLALRFNAHRGNMSPITVKHVAYPGHAAHKGSTFAAGRVLRAKCSASCGGRKPILLDIRSVVRLCLQEFARAPSPESSL